MPDQSTANTAERLVEEMFARFRVPTWLLPGLLGRFRAIGTNGLIAPSWFWFTDVMRNVFDGGLLHLMTGGVG